MREKKYRRGAPGGAPPSFPRCPPLLPFIPPPTSPRFAPISKPTEFLAIPLPSPPRPPPPRGSPERNRDEGFLLAVN
ncbi:hypothetical protein ZWY2020_001986 [Hordeum vulgare]|nr:hypothetical protein ZWY2020_001986 [Hordeum vulgare]